MTQKKMDLKEMGLIQMDAAETQEVNGGNIFELVGQAIGATVHFLVYAVKDAVQHPIRPSEYR